MLEVVHQYPDALGVSRSSQRRQAGPVAPAESEQIDDHHAMAFRHLAHDAVPQMRRCRKPVQENHRLARAASPGGVVVESRDTEVDKLAAHRGKMDAVQVARQARVQAQSHFKTK